MDYSRIIARGKRSNRAVVRRNNMQDRFKMRAWDENNKIMHYDFQFIKSGDNGNDWIIFQSDKQKLDFDKEKNFCINVYPNPYFAQQLKIMQSTGLKDKNGKLIYEGDIITDDFDKYVIEWEGEPNFQYFAVWLPIETCKTCSTLEQLLSIEVIGNIYENKDLLE